MEKYYQILGLAPGASSGEVKQAHRDLVKVWHPDRFAHDPKLQAKAQERLKEINHAFEQLKMGGGSYRTKKGDPAPDDRSRGAEASKDTYRQPRENSASASECNDWKSAPSKSIRLPWKGIIYLMIAIGIIRFSTPVIYSFIENGGWGEKKYLVMNGKKYLIQGPRKLTDRDRDIIDELISMYQKRISNEPIQYRGFSIVEDRS